MPVPKHFRFTVRGHFDGSPETWVTGCHFNRVYPAEPDTGLGDISESGAATAVSAHFNSVDYGAHVVVDDFRFYEIGTDGKMESNGPLLHTFAANSVKGTGSAWKFPPQVALCMTLVSSNRGAARMGRMYMPGPNADLAADGRLSTAQADGILGRFVTFLKNLSDTIDAPATLSAHVANVSPGPPGSTVGTIQQVDHVECGRVYDTVRNRRKSMLEERRVGGHIDW